MPEEKRKKSSLKDRLKTSKRVPVRDKDTPASADSSPGSFINPDDIEKIDPTASGTLFESVLQEYDTLSIDDGSSKPASPPPSPAQRASKDITTDPDAIDVDLDPQVFDSVLKEYDEKSIDPEKKPPAPNPAGEIDLGIQKLDDISPESEEHHTDFEHFTPTEHPKTPAVAPADLGIEQYTRHSVTPEPSSLSDLEHFQPPPPAAENTDKTPTRRLPDLEVFHAPETPPTSEKESTEAIDDIDAVFGKLTQPESESPLPSASLEEGTETTSTPPSESAPPDALDLRQQDTSHSPDEMTIDNMFIGSGNPNIILESEIGTRADIIDRESLLADQLRAFFTAEREAIELQLTEHTPQIETRRRDSLTEEYYLKILLDAEDEDCPSRVSLFVNLQMFHIMAIRNEVEQAIAHHSENLEKTLKITDKITKIWNALPRQKRDLFINKMLATLSTKAIERGIGYLNLILAEINLLDKHHIYDYLRLAIVSQLLRERNSGLTLSKEFELVRQFSNLLKTFYEGNDPPAKVEEAIETLFTGRSGVNIDVITQIDGSPMHRMLSALGDLDANMAKHHIDWIILQLQPLSLQEKTEYVRDIANGLVSLRNAVWNGLSRVEIVPVERMRWFLNELILHFQKVPAPVWQVFASKKMEPAVTNILGIANHRSPWYFRQLLPHLTTIKTVSGTIIWHIFSTVFDLLTDPDFFQNLFVEHFNEWLAKQEVPPVTEDELIDGTFAVCLKKTKPEDYIDIRRAILERQEIAFFEQLIRLLNVDKLRPTEFAQNFLSPVIAYLNLLTFPLTEFSAIVQDLTGKKKVAPQRLRIALEVGTYLEKHYDYFRNLSEAQDKLAFKVSIIRHFTEIGELLGITECERFLHAEADKPSIMIRYLGQMSYNRAPIANIGMLVSQLQPRNVPQRVLIVHLGALIEERLGAKLREVDSGDLYDLREKTMILCERIDRKSQFKFIEEGLGSLLDRIFSQDQMITLLTRLINALDTMQRPELIPRFLNRVAPSIVENFGSDPDLMYDNLCWAINIYDKNASESLIFSGLEDKMKSQMRHVGEKLLALPGIIRRTAKEMGASEDDVRQLMSSLRQISIQFAELEMMTPEQQIGTSHVINIQKKSKTTVKEVTNRFLDTGVGTIVAVLLRYPKAIQLFQNRKENIPEMLNIVMPVDTISSEDVSIALGSASKPVLYEERGLIFIQAVVPAAIEAANGLPEIAQDLLWQIVRSLQREIRNIDLGVSFLQNCAETLQNYAIQRILFQTVLQVESLRGRIQHFDTLQRLAKKAMPYHEKEDAHPDPETLRALVQAAVKSDQAKTDLHKQIIKEIDQLLNGISFEPQILDRLRYHASQVLLTMGDAGQVKSLVEESQVNDPDLAGWRGQIADQKAFVFWLKRMEEGLISKEIEWMRDSEWYALMARQYLEQMGSRLPAIIRSAKDFEKIANKQEIIRYYFEEWEHEKLGLLGLLVFRALAFHDGPIEPLRVLQTEMEQVHLEQVHQKGTRHLFLEQALKQMREMRNGQEISYPRGAVVSNSLQVKLHGQLTEPLNQEVIQHRMEQCLQPIPDDIQTIVSDMVKWRIGRVEQYLPEGESLTSHRLRFAVDYALPFVFAEVALVSVGNAQVETALREQLKQVSWTYGGSAKRRSRVHEYQIIFEQFINNIKELFSKEGVLDIREVNRIEREMPQQYNQSLDALTVLMNWTMDSEK
ncbi:MAG: hypothetical protein D6675_09910, partial [Gemmatimonadetes bacterium]